MLVMLLSCPGWLSADEDNETDDAPPAAFSSHPVAGPPDNHRSVTLNDHQQQSAGLSVQVLDGLAVHAEQIASATVLDLRPLMEWRAAYRAAETDLAQAEAARLLSQQNRQRVLALHREDILASRVLVEAESHYAGDEARTLAARRKREDVRWMALQSYGPELARLWLEGDSALLRDWLALRRVLLLVSLPASANVTETLQAKQIAVGRGSEKSSARSALLLSRAPATDPLTQGETFYYHASAEGLRTGMRLKAFVPSSGPMHEAVILPQTAVLWQAGQAWVYRQVAPGQFSRIAITGHQDQGDNWLVSEGLKPGDRVVVTGGQMLLSEELKRQIPDEDDD